jgi:hypothetical protein
MEFKITYCSLVDSLWNVWNVVLEKDGKDQLH